MSTTTTMTTSPPLTTLSWNIEHPDLILGVVEALGVTVRDSGPALRAAIDAAVAARASEGLPERTRAAIRGMLRREGYKPSGRGKPASEYLVATASKGTFPSINALVDINNLLSLRTGWPMSVLDRALALDDAEGLEVRYGRQDEQYVFNASGQLITLTGLLGVGRVAGELLANPVRDAMTAKTHADTRDVIALLYTSREVASEAEVLDVARSYAEALGQHTGAPQTSARVLSGSSGATLAPE